MPIEWFALDGATNLFPRVEIYGPTNTLLTTLNLSNIGSGRYRTTYTPTNKGVHTCQFKVYTSGAYTTLVQDYSTASGIFNAQNIENLDNVDVAVSSRESETDANTKKQAIIDAVDLSDGQAF